MNIIKRSEKILVWMHRKDVTQLKLAKSLGTTRQTIARKLKENNFDSTDLIKLNLLGYSE